MPGATEIFQQMHAARAELADLRQQMTHGPLQLKSSQAKLDKKAAAAAALHDEAKTLRKAADAKDLQIRTAEARTLDLRGKLNASNNVKEFDALKEEIARIQASIDGLESEGLELLGQQEAKAAEAAAAVADLAAGKAEHAKLKELIDYKVEKFRVRCGEVETRLADLLPKLEADARSLYDRAVGARGEEGLAPCANGVCGMCFTQVTPQSAGNLRLGRPEVCRSCGALLFCEA